MTLFDMHNPPPADDLPALSAATRTSHPDTSRTAAGSLTPDYIRETQARVRALLYLSGPMTDKQLVALWRRQYGEATTDSSIRTRRCELVRSGVVEEHDTVKQPGGRPETRWRVK